MEASGIGQVSACGAMPREVALVRIVLASSACRRDASSARSDTAALQEVLALIVSDIIYNPKQTRLLQMASANGCATFNGLYMLLFQGAEAFRLWTGKEMPIEPIREHYFKG